MGIIARAFHVGRSHLNALVSSVESPQRSIRLLILDMEDTLVKARSAAIKSIAEKRSLERRAVQMQADVEEWQGKAEAAIMAARDDLAAEALQVKGRHAASLSVVRQQLDALAQALSAQSDDMMRLQDKLQDAKSRERAARSLYRTASTRFRLRKSSFDHRIDTAFAKFAQVEGMLDTVEGGVASFDLGRRDQDLSTKLNRLAIESSANTELAELKARLGNRIALSSPGG